MLCEYMLKNSSMILRLLSISLLESFFSIDFLISWVQCLVHV